MNRGQKSLFLRGRVLRGLLILVFATMGFVGCSKRGDSGYQGYVEGRYVYVSTPQAGRLDHLAAARGDTVNASQALFTLDQEPEHSAELQARKTLLADEGRLADLKTGKRPPEKDVISAQLAQAKVELQKSEDLLKSDEAQYAAGGFSLTDLISARAAVAANAAIVRQFQSNLEVAALPGREEQIAAQAAVVAADKAALQQAKWKLQQKQVAAPKDGLVFDTLYREGDWVAAGTPVVQMLPPANVEVRFFVPETIVGKLKIGQKVNVHCDGCDAEVAGEISFVSNQVEYTPPVIYSNENRSKLVFMVIARPAADKAASLHPGQPVEVTLP